MNSFTTKRSITHSTPDRRKGRIVAARNKNIEKASTVVIFGTTSQLQKSKTVYASDTDRQRINHDAADRHRTGKGQE